MEQFYRLNKVAYHNSANCNFVSFDFTKDIHIAGRNNLGKTAKLNGIQIGYLPHSTFKGAGRKFNFDKDYTEEASFDFYFPENNSYIIYEFENPHGVFTQIVYRGTGDLQIERVFIPKSYSEILHWFWMFGDNDEIGLPTRISRKEFLEEVNAITGSKIVKSAQEAKSIMYNGSLTNYELGKYSVASVNENRVDNILDILKLTSNASSIDSNMLRKIIISLLKTSYQDNERDSMQYNPVELMEQFTRIKNDREFITKKKNYLNLYTDIKSAYEVLNQELLTQDATFNLYTHSINRMMHENSNLLSEKQRLLNDKDNEQTALHARGKQINKELSNISGQLTQIKKSITLKENTEKEYQEIMFGKDSGWIIYNGDNERVLEEIDSLIKELNEDIKRIKNIENTVRSYNKELQTKETLLRNKSYIETQIKNIENLFITNEKVRNISGKLHAINPSFSSLSDTVSDEDISKIVEFCGIFDDVDGNLVLNDVSFGKIGIQERSIAELKKELNDINAEIEALDRHIHKLKEIIDSDDTKQAENKKEELKLCKHEKSVINRYISMKDELHELKKDREQLLTQESNKSKENDEHRKTYREATQAISNLKEEISPLKKALSDLGDAKKELSTQARLNNYSFESSEIDDSELLSDLTLIDVDDVEQRFATIKSAKGCITTNLRQLVNLQLVDDESGLLVRSTVDYSLIYETLVSPLSSVFESIDADEEELNKAFSRQAQLIMDLSGDLEHYLGRYKSYIRKLNKQLDSVNLSSISKIEIKADFEPRVERFIETIEQYGLSSDDAITSMDNGLEEQIRSFIKDMHLEKSKNMAIDVETLIKKISLKYINENNFVTTKGSNGTSIITSIILISMFTREICGDDIDIIMPINLDEIGSVDWNNTKTVFDFIKAKGFCLFSAAPTIPNTAIDMFDAVIPLEDYEFIENADVFLSNYRMTYHYTMGGMIDDEDDIIEVDDIEPSLVDGVTDDQ